MSKRKQRRWLIRGLILIALALIVFAIFLRVRYGGGKLYEDVSSSPIYGQQDLDNVFQFGEPIGNVAASKTLASHTRLFFTVHPESRPTGPKLLEIVDGRAQPYPSGDYQNKFDTPLGIFTDFQNRLWVIDHGTHGLGSVTLTAFDLASDSVLVRHNFPRDVARRFSFFNDLSVSPDGRFVAVANVSFFGKNPSIALFDTHSGKSRNVLEDHPSLRHESFVPVADGRKMRFLGGLVTLQVGIDGLDFSKDGRYLYFAPMGGSKLFRVPANVVTDFSLADSSIAAAIETVAAKPLSDGIRTDANGNVYVTDIENRGVFVLSPEGHSYTLIKDDRIRWADGMSVGGSGDIYLADSAIPDQMLRSRKHITSSAPYNIFRFRPQSSDTAPAGDSRRILRAAFLATETVFNSELMAPYDILHHTIFRKDSVYIEPFIVTPDGKSVTTFEGLTIDAHFSFANAPPIDILIIPSTNNSMDADLMDNQLISWIKSTSESASWVLTLCDGAFPLAQTGLLHGRVSTTFPGDRDRFAEMYPDITVRYDREFVVDGKFITSVGGALSYNPALYLVETLLSKTAAEETAEGMVLDWKPACRPASRHRFER